MDETDIDVTVEIEHPDGQPPRSHVRVYEIRQDLPQDQLLAEAVADTAWEALLDCSRQLELAAKKGPSS